MIGRLAGLAAGEALDRADLGRGELVPPLGQDIQPLRNLVLQGRDADGGGLFLDLHADGENTAHHADQLVDAMIVNAVLRRGEKAVLPAEAEDVPGIDQGPAFDRAVQQADRFFQQPGGMFQPRSRVIARGLADPRVTRRCPAPPPAALCTSSMARWAVVSRQWMSHFSRAEATGTTRACRWAASV